MRARLRLLPVLTLCLVTVALAAAGPPVGAAPPEAPPPWQSRGETGHALVGRIWRAADGAFIARDTLARALAGADLVLLGETHDNPDHHRIQAWAVGQLAAAGKRPAIALEMIRSDQQAQIEAHFQARPGDVAGLGKALGWERSGWPDWRHYAQVIAPLAPYGVAVTGANLPVGTIRAIARDGFKVLGENRLRRLALDRPLSEAIYGAVEREIVDVHCGQIQRRRARPFATIQIARDAALADGLLAAARRAGGTAVLVAGSGHVRRDRGVPLHLTRRGTTGAVAILAPIEVRVGATAPAAYGEAYGEAYGAPRPPFDFVWFTPRQDREDPCASFRKNN